MPSPDTVLPLLRRRFPELSPALQGAARFLLDHPNEVVVMSMRALAERAGVPPATLVRLAQQLGFAGWPGLKAAFVDELGLGSEHYGRRAKGLLARHADAALSAEMFGAQRRNLELTEAGSGPALRRAARLMARAGAVHVAGFRASFPIAYSLVYVYRLFRDSVHLVDGLAGSLEMHLQSFARRDAVVAVSFAPYSREALAVVEAARAKGCRIVALTDSSASPLSLAADATILFAAASPSFFPSIAAGVAAAEALLEVLVAQAGAPGVARIERAEAYLRASGAYLDAAARRRKPA
jgi:DNA-binding MurR/RpiR family transcriptional regulator